MYLWEALERKKFRGMCTSKMHFLKSDFKMRIFQRIVAFLFKFLQDIKKNHDLYVVINIFVKNDLETKTMSSKYIICFNKRRTFFYIQRKWHHVSM